MVFPVVEVEHLGKKFRRGESFDTLRDLIPGTLRRLRQSDSRREDRWFWALRDVSFSVNAGEVLGIVGANGAGKSTVLKILARILRPTTGRLMVRGRLRALIEIAAGFHPDLTGRENIYLNAAILGMKMSEVRKRFDDIVEFAGIGPFLDTPVKRYSSGMFARLGFAVAAHLEPDILVVDEVLAVGDAAFQAKCLGKMRDVAGQGRTVIFVSHNMRAIQQLCHRVLLLERGSIVREGPPTEVVEAYLARALSHGASGECSLSMDPAMPIVVSRVRVLSENGDITTLFPRSERVVLEIEGTVNEGGRRYIVALDIRTIDGLLLFRTHSFEQPESYRILDKKGPFVLRCYIPSEFLSAGRYEVGIVVAERGVCEFENRHRIIAFDVFQDHPLRGSDIMTTVGLVTPHCDWERIR
ncbi:MAG: ABC transporter ATP-binding protein [Thermogutta sp.]|nr:ABC transporter ATP-binding protein [Thermogutta sp.]